jgi:hypothetical protein
MCAPSWYFAQYESGAFSAAIWDAAVRRWFAILDVLIQIGIGGSFAAASHRVAFLSWTALELGASGKVPAVWLAFACVLSICRYLCSRR